MSETIKEKSPEGKTIPPAKTAFTDQPFELICEGYVCTDAGVFTKSGKTVCLHPILPAGGITDYETRRMSLKIAFNAAGYWEEHTYPRTVLASPTAILSLSAAGVAVTAENARLLCAYLTNLYHMNAAVLPKKWSVPHLGWASRYSDCFVPFSENVECDAEEAFRAKTDAVHFGGDERKWAEAVAPLWHGNLPARLMLDASFASALLTPLDLQPFFVHVWGQTGLGKTVLLQLAASVWGDPAPGRLITTFNATSTGLELTAAFLHDIPMLIDELQIASAAGKNDFQHLIYTLSEGVGRTRGAKDGGLQRQPTWRSVMVTSGERPLSTEFSGGGALNRCIELELTKPVTEDFTGLMKTVSANYGAAGYRFVQEVVRRRELLPRIMEGYQEDLISFGVSGKQAAAMAALQLADGMCGYLFFKKEGKPTPPLSAAEVAPLLLPKEEICAEKRALQYLFDIIAANPAHFPDVPDPTRPVEIWGRTGKEYTAVIGAVFTRIMEEGGFSPRATLSYADRNGLLMKDEGHLKKAVKICGKNIRCVIIKQP